MVSRPTRRALIVVSRLPYSADTHTFATGANVWGTRQRHQRAGCPERFTFAAIGTPVTASRVLHPWVKVVVFLRERILGAENIDIPLDDTVWVQP